MKHLILLAALLAGCGTPAGGGADLGDLEARVQALEEQQKRLDEIESFLTPIMEQAKAEEARRAATEHDPNARFAVPVVGNAIDGPPNAAVTIIEAWDFA